MEVYVRSRKYGTMMDTAGFSLADGPDTIYDLSRFQIGDHVSLFVDLTREQGDAIDNIRTVSGIYVSGGPSMRQSTEIKFIIVDKRHYIGLRKPLSMSWAGSQIVLEAETGYYEDVYLWVTEKIVPTWARDEQEGEVGEK